MEPKTRAWCGRPPSPLLKEKSWSLFEVSLSTALAQALGIGGVSETGAQNVRAGKRSGTRCGGDSYRSCLGFREVPLNLGKWVSSWVGV